MQFTLLCLPLLAALVAAIPNVPGARVTPSPLANKRDLSHITVMIKNKMKQAVTTTVASNPGVPTLLSSPGNGTMGNRTIAPNATAILVAPRGWNGNVAFALANATSMQAPSLIEPGLTEVMGTWMMDIDVSYVIGYTVPITCTCNADHSFMSGCSKDLWATSPCPAEDLKAAQGACVNPTNEPEGKATNATAFFAPCAGKAYTFPSDNGANSEGKCLTGSATCCVGTEADGCPATS